MKNYHIELTEEQEKLLIPLLEALHIDFKEEKKEKHKANGKAQELELPTPLAQKSEYAFEEIEEYAALFPNDYMWKAKDLEIYFPKDLKVSVQIIQNQLFIMPSPNFNHQAISEELGFQMGLFVRQQKAGKIIYAPIDVHFNESNVLQPDIIFIAVSRYHIIDENKKVVEAPDVVVEIWSPSNSKKEKEMKRKTYQNEGITEYWQIFPKKQQVKIDVLNDEGKYELFSEAKKTGKVKSRVLNGFEMDIETLFEETGS